MKKTYSRISAVLLAAGMMVIPSCGKKSPEAAPVSSSAAVTAAASSYDAQNTEKTDPPAPVLANSAQLEVIVKSKSTWYVDGDADMRYAVTDLDMNGRYEITAAKKNQSFAMFEVTEDGTGIAKVDAPFEHGSSGPYMEEEYRLRVNKEGAYVYVAREFDEAGDSGEKTTYYYLVSLSNGKLTAELLASEMLGDDGNVRYGDDEFAISKEDFKQKTDTGLPPVEHVLTVAWGDGNAVAGMNDAKALEAICFRQTK